MPKQMWTAKEVELLRKNYPKIGWDRTAKLLKRSKQSVFSKAQKLKIHGKKGPGHWTRAELKLLRAGWADCSARWLRMKLPGRTERAIRSKAIELNLGPRLQGYMSISDAAKMLGVCIPECLRIIEMEGVMYRRVRSTSKYARRFVDEEDIREAGLRYLQRENMHVAAERLGVTADCLHRGLRHAGKTGGPRKVWRLFPEEWDRILAEWRGYTNGQGVPVAKRPVALAIKKPVRPATYFARTDHPGTSPIGSEPSTSLQSTQHIASTEDYEETDYAQ